MAEEIRVCPLRPTPNPPTQLVELCQTEHIRPVDDQGIGTGDIESRFNDGGADQHVNFVVDEIHHDLFEFISGHLTMGHGNAGLRGEFLNGLSHAMDGLDPVVHDKHLAAP